MIRTQIYLQESMYTKLVSLKKSTKKSVGNIIRDILEKNIKGEYSSTKNDILKLATINIEGGPKDLSENLDNYLY